MQSKTDMFAFIQFCLTSNMSTTFCVIGATVCHKQLHVKTFIDFLIQFHITLDTGVNQLFSLQIVCAIHAL